MASTATDRADDPAQTNDTLSARLIHSDQFEYFVDDCTSLVVTQIKHKGMTLRTAFSVVRKVKPNILERTVREQMPDFIRELEPFYAAYRESDTPDFAAYLSAREEQVAHAILNVADRRAERIHSRTIRSAYQRIRGRAQREVRSAVPELAAIIARHLKRAAA